VRFGPFELDFHSAELASAQTAILSGHSPSHGSRSKGSLGEAQIRQEMINEEQPHAPLFRRPVLLGVRKGVFPRSSRLLLRYKGENEVGKN